MKVLLRVKCFDCDSDAPTQFINPDRGWLCAACAKQDEADPPAEASHP